MTLDLSDHPCIIGAPTWSRTRTKSLEDSYDIPFTIGAKFLHSSKLTKNTNEGMCSIQLSYGAWGPHLPTGHLVSFHCVFSARMQPHFVQTPSLACSHVRQWLSLFSFSLLLAIRESDIAFPLIIGAGYQNRTDDESLENFSFAIKLIPHIWCDWSDSNRHVQRRLILSQLRIPDFATVAKLVGYARFELATPCSQSRCTTRLC